MALHSGDRDLIRQLTENGPVVLLKPKLPNVLKMRVVDPAGTVVGETKAGLANSALSVHGQDFTVGLVGETHTLLDAQGAQVATASWNGPEDRLELSYGEHHYGMHSGATMAHWLIRDPWGNPVGAVTTKSMQGRVALPEPVEIAAFAYLSAWRIKARKTKPGK